MNIVDNDIRMFSEVTSSHDWVNSREPDGKERGDNFGFRLGITIKYNNPTQITNSMALEKWLEENNLKPLIPCITFELLAESILRVRIEAHSRAECYNL